MNSHIGIAHEMEHDLGASNYVTSEQISPLLTNQREASQDIQHVSFIQLLY